MALDQVKTAEASYRDACHCLQDEQNKFVPKMNRFLQVRNIFFYFYKESKMILQKKKKWSIFIVFDCFLFIIVKDFELLERNRVQFIDRCLQKLIDIESSSIDTLKVHELLFIFVAIDTIFFKYIYWIYLD